MSTFRPFIRKRNILVRIIDILVIVYENFSISIDVGNRYYHFRFPVPGRVCTDISLVAKTSGYDWSFGSCSNSHKFVVPGIYIEKCCQLPGRYTLTCKSSSKTGWKGNHVLVQGHKHCDDIVGYEAMRTLEVTGQ